MSESEQEHFDEDSESSLDVLLGTPAVKWSSPLVHSLNVTRGLKKSKSKTNKSNMKKNPNLNPLLFKTADKNPKDT